MSVVPFVLQGANKSVVTNSEEFHHLGGVESNVLLIKDIDSGQLGEDSQDSNTSYDLRVGCEYWDHNNIHKTELDENGIIKILPGSSVIIQTEEYMEFPRSRFGQIIPKVGLMQKGITNTTSKVDPGYSGHLLITVFNLGKQSITLKRKDKFCSLVLSDVLPGGTLYKKVPKRIVGRIKRSRWSDIMDVLNANSGLIGTVALIISTILTLVGFFKGIIKF